MLSGVTFRGVSSKNKIDYQFVKNGHVLGVGEGYSIQR